MNHAISLASAGTYDIDPETDALAFMVVYNEGPDNIYYGKKAAAAFIIEGAENESTVTDTSPVVTFARPVGSQVKQGMAISGSGIPGATTVLAVNGTSLTMSANATSTEVASDITFTPPTLASTNGIPILPEQKEYFSATHNNRFLQQGFRLLTATGETAVVRILKKPN